LHEDFKTLFETHKSPFLEFFYVLQVNEFAKLATMGVFLEEKHAINVLDIGLVLILLVNIDKH